MLFGWTQCPCTGYATNRFLDEKICYDKRDWSASSEPLMSFFTCLYGSQHHSFIFVGGGALACCQHSHAAARPPVRMSILRVTRALQIADSASIDCHPQRSPIQTTARARRADGADAPPLTR